MGYASSPTLMPASFGGASGKARQGRPRRRGAVARPAELRRRKQLSLHIMVVIDRPRERSRYCLSYTAVFLNSLPCGSVPLVVTVRLLPSADTTIRPLTVTLPSFLTVNARVRSSIFLYDRASEVGSPVTA